MLAACSPMVAMFLSLQAVRRTMVTTTARKHRRMTVSARLRAYQQQNSLGIRRYKSMDLQNNQQDNKDPLQQFYDIHDSEMIKLEIKQSSLPFSGQGLFATHPIHQHEIIAEYYGSVIRTQHSMDKEFAYEDKMVQIDSQICVISRGPASRANDIVRWEPSNYNSDLFRMLRKKLMLPTHANYSHNAKISIDPNQKAFLKATRLINPGQQIFIDYGFDYWDFFYREYIAKKN